MPDESGENAMDVAVKDRNVRFVSDVQVSRILSTIWATPNYMTSIEFVDYGIDRKCKTIAALLITAPNEFFRSNRGKFVIWAFGFLSFLVLFSIMGIHGVVVNDSLRTLESIVWVMGAHYIIGEFVEIYNRGVTTYWTSSWNICDSLFSIVFMCIMFIRWISFPLTDDSPLIENRQQIYNMLMAFGTILIWLRVSYLFVINATLGPFIRMMACFVRDVYIFLYLLLVLMVGFGIALHIVVGNEVESHRTVLGSIFTLYQAGLGDFSFDSFQELPRFQLLTAQTLLAVYLACAAVVLVNLLIAMLAETFSSIQQDQRLEFMFGRAVTTWDFNRSNNVLPPPFNGLVYGLALIFRILSCCYTPSWSRDNDGDDEDCELDDLESNGASRKVSKDWCCARCHCLCKGTSEVGASIGVRHWIMSINLKVPDSLQHIETLPITLCSHCHRLKHPISRAGLVREQISYMVFLLCIFLPALILLLLPTLLHLAGSVIYQRLSKTRYWYSMAKRTSYIRRHLTGRKRTRDIDGKMSMKSSKWVSLSYQEFSAENEAA